MGRVRKTLRFVFSVGSYDGLSPIAKDSERTALLKEQNELIADRASGLSALLGGKLRSMT